MFTPARVLLDNDHSKRTRSLQNDRTRKGDSQDRRYGGSLDAQRRGVVIPLEWPLLRKMRASARKLIPTPASRKVLILRPDLTQELMVSAMSWKCEGRR